MAPFRNRDRSNRSGRGQVEHNVLEGLPINQYREAEITIGNNSIENKQVDKDAWPELPMPRDSHLLPEHSQQILRAARSGRTYKPPVPQEEDAENVDEENEHKEVPTGFSVKKWVKVARHLEEPEPEYLAKRRKGLPSQYAVGAVSAQPMAMRETKVKKTDAEGNVVVYKALVPEGQAVEGEVQETDAVIEAAPVAAAPGTIVEGVGIVNAEGVVVANDIMQQTPPRRKPPPPKKKKRSGPGRGRKKVVFVEGAAEQGTPASGVSRDLLAVPENKPDGSVEPSEGGDTPMPDAGDEGEDSGEDGSDDDENEERSHSPTPADDIKMKTPPTSAPAVELPKVSVVEDVPMKDASPPPTSTKPVSPPTAPVETKAPTPPQPELEQVPKVARDPSSSPEMPLISHSRQNSTTQIPTLDSLNDTSETPVETKAPTPPVEPAATASPPPAEKVPTPQEPATVEPGPVEAEPEAPKAEEPKAEEPKADEPTAEEPKVEEPKAEEPQVEEPKTEEPPATEIASIGPPAAEPKVPESDAPEPKPVEPDTTEPTATEPSAPEPTAAESNNAEEDDEHDILGSLEAQLEKERDSESKGGA